MVERPRSTSAQESSPLHERGGLTPEHWQLIARNLPKRSKPRKLANAILAGLVNPNDSYQYLGKKDWNVIWGRHLGSSFKGNDTAKQIVDVAYRMGEVINLNEYFGYKIRWRSAGHWEWSRLKRNWFFRELLSEREVFWEHPAGHGVEGYIDQKWSKRLWLGKDSVEVSAIRRAYLLGQEDDILNLTDKSPSALVKLAKTKPEEVLVERLGQVKSGGKVSGWVKPIPKAA